MQRASIELLSAFISIFFRGGLAIVVSFVPIWLASLTDLTTTEKIVSFLSRWDVIVIATIVVTAGYAIKVRVWPSN